MESFHRFLTNDRNLVSAATAAATNTLSSNAIRRTAVSREGNGTVGLSGPYTGAAATDVDVEIVSGTGTPRVSTAVFSGVGSGTISDHAAQAGATSQTYTVTLIDKGTRTAIASVDVEGYTLSAQASGAGGNDISITVDRSGLVYTATNFSLIEELSEGTTESTASGLDWDTAIAVGDEVPPGAKRFVIGDDKSVVYRQWKKYTSGEWVYHFAPALVRDYAAGARIYDVTGSRSVTVTDDITPEAYTGVITLYDLLSQIDASSDLLEVDPIPSPDQLADNLAAVLDLRTNTDARIDWTGGTTRAPDPGFVDHYAGPSAATELVTAECYANNTGSASLGRELWTLKGSVSGDLGDLRTDVHYVHPLGRFGARIPVYLPPGADVPHGDIGAQVEYVSRDDGEVSPPICVDPLRKGASASSQSIEFVYAARPVVGNCDCEDLSFRRIPGICFNDADGEENIDMGNLAAGHAIRIVALQEWHKEFVEANTELDSTSSELHSAINDLHLGDLIRDIYGKTLSRMYGDGINTWTDWAASTAVALNETRLPTTKNGYKYTATVAGTTAGSEPTWPTVIGNTVVDNTVTWTCVSKTPEVEFDDAVDDLGTELSALKAIQADSADFDALDPVAASTAYVVGDLVLGYAESTDTINSAVWTCIRAGTTPASSYELLTAVFGTVTHVGTAAAGPMFICLGAMPKYSDADINTDNEDFGFSGVVEQFVRRYQARADYILTLAEVLPDFDYASGEGNACWHDPGDIYWWEPKGTGYLPAFNNVQYASVKRDADGEIYATHEFSFVFRVACIDDLKLGDSVTITIDGDGSTIGYQIGDTLQMAVIAADSLDLGGGVTGSDEQTWSVKRSVDGPGTDYTQDIDTPALYDDGDVQFRLTPGGIADAIGDYWTFCVESGKFKWREDGGAWSADTDIGATALSDGLSLAFTEGACPSFVVGDTVSWDVLQPHAIDGAASPDGAAFAWTGAGTVITLTITGTVDVIALAMHTLPSGATVNVADGVALNEDLTWRSGPMVLPLDTPLTDPTITITIGSATGGTIGWLWAGEAITMDNPAQTQRRRKRWNMLDGAGRNARNGADGAGWGYTLTFKPFETSATVTSLLAAIDEAKSDGDAPLIFVPQSAIPGEAELVRWPDEIELDDWRNSYWEDDTALRYHPLTLELAPWFI